MPFWEYALGINECWAQAHTGMSGGYTLSERLAQREQDSVANIFSANDYILSKRGMILRVYSGSSEYNLREWNFWCNG